MFFGGDMTVLQGLVPVQQQTVSLMLEAGQLLSQMGRFKQALDVMEGLAHLLPDSGIPSMFKGNLLFAQGRLAQAEAAHREAVERAPDQAACWAHLGEALLWSGKVEEGLEACEKAMGFSDDPHAKRFAKNLVEAQELGCFEKVER